MDNGLIALPLNGHVEELDVEGINGEEDEEGDLTPCVVFHIGPSRVLSYDETQSALEEQKK